MDAYVIRERCALAGDTHSFIVRILFESHEDENCEWRGSIEHVGSHKRLHFQELDSLKDFIQEETGLCVNKQKPWWHSLYVRYRDGFKREKQQTEPHGHN